jgi:hypothetical protein
MEVELMAKPIKWETSNREASRYTRDGAFVRKLPTPRTVSELRVLLEDLPDTLPIKCGFADYVALTWVNLGEDGEHIEFAEDSF